jgi:hypothetical protein
MGTYLNRGVNFTTGQQVTAADLQNLVDNATLATGAADGVTVEISSNTITVANGGISPTKLSTGGPAWDSSGNLTATGNITGVNLVASGTATITGDVAVDTDVLKVDTSNNRVGINNAAPTEALEVTGNTIVSGTLSTSGGNFDVDISGNITDVGTITSDSTITGTTVTGTTSVVAPNTPKALGKFTIDAGTYAATTAGLFGVTSVAYTSSDDSGDIRAYTVTLSSALADTNYIVNVTRGSNTIGSASAKAAVPVFDGDLSTTVFKIAVDTPTAADIINFEVISA